jgi:hypothetical protein
MCERSETWRSHNTEGDKKQICCGRILWNQLVDVVQIALHEDVMRFVFPDICAILQFLNRITAPSTGHS